MLARLGLLPVALLLCLALAAPSAAAPPTFGALALSAPVASGAVPPPALLDAPVIAGPAKQGGRLTCRAGAWIDADSFAFDWLRNGDQVAGGATYSPVRADVGRALQCRVTASGPGGSAVATSDPLVIGARDCVVPRLAGLKLSRAGRALKAAGCRLGKVQRSPSAKVRRGRVISSAPRTGARRAPATKVVLRVSSGPHS